MHETITMIEEFRIDRGGSYILGAVYGTGKTRLALRMMADIVIYKNLKVAYITLATPKKTIVHRMQEICHNIDWAGENLFINDTYSLTMDGLKECIESGLYDGVDVLFVDEINLMHTNQYPNCNGYRMLMAEFKKIAITHNIAVISLYEISEKSIRRNVEFKPLFCNFPRGIFENVDGVMTLYRESLYNCNSLDDRMEISYQNGKDTMIRNAVLYL